MRLDTVGTETINIAGMNSNVTQEVRVSPGHGTVWVESDSPVKVQLLIEPDAAPEPEKPGFLQGGTGAEAS